MYRTCLVMNFAPTPNSGGVGKQRPQPSPVPPELRVRGLLLQTVAYKMPDNDVRPPKPKVPDPLTEYDEVIAAKLAVSSSPISGRLMLVKALHEQERLDFRQALTLANSYCDRHGLFVSGKATKAFGWGCCGMTFAALCLAVFNGYLLLVRREAVLSQPHHHAALMALDKQEMVVVAAIALLVIGSITISVTIRGTSRRRR